MASNENSLWLTWETQRRNSELAEAFSAEYLPLDYSSQNSLIRLILSSQKTIQKFFSSTYKTIFTQYPSLYLCLLIACLRNFKEFTWVIDLHNIGADDLESKSIRKTLTSFVCKRADYIIISNKGLSRRLEKFSSKLIVLPDKLPNIPKQKPVSFLNPKNKNITLVCSFADDEPTEDFIKGFLSSKAPKDSVLYITGKKKLAAELLRYENSKVIFTDFLTTEDFDSLIQNSSLIVDLTTRENCLVCGAYEAISVEVPILLSKTNALENTFPKGAIFSENLSTSYVASLEVFFQNEEKLKKEVVEMKKEFIIKWSKQFKSAQKKIFGAE